MFRYHSLLCSYALNYLPFLLSTVLPSNLAFLFCEHQSIPVNIFNNTCTETTKLASQMTHNNKKCTVCFLSLTVLSPLMILQGKGNITKATVSRTTNTGQTLWKDTTNCKLLS